MDTIKPEYDFFVARVAAPLRQSVTESIRNAIAIGRFQAGQRMAERDLCTMTGVSRTLVREALRQLETEGVIKVVPHRGPVVATFTPKQALGIYQVRAVLEGLGAELFAVHATEADRMELAKAFEGVKHSYLYGDVVERLDAKNRFYQCLLEGSGNEALGSALQMLNFKITVLRAHSLQAPDRQEASLAELENLIEALNRQDPEAARNASVFHVRRAAASAIRTLRAARRAKKHAKT